MPTSDDALIARLDRYLDLTAAERAALARCQGEPYAVAAGDHLLDEGGPAVSLYVVQRGWLHSSARLADGARQILRFHFAGDLMGTSSIAWHRAATTLTAVTDCIVADLPKEALGWLFREQPRLAGLLYAVSASEAVAMSDRLTSIGRMEAPDRLATLLLDIRARLRATSDLAGETFELPLTQTEIGDATGMTKVHVNRTLRAMDADGTIARTRSNVRIVDPAALAQTVGFVDRYDEVATDWLPPVAEAEPARLVG